MKKLVVSWCMNMHFQERYKIFKKNTSASGFFFKLSDVFHPNSQSLSSSVKGKNRFVIVGKDLPGGPKSKPYHKVGGSNSI